MQIAITNDNRRVHINAIIPGENYICPVCHALLIPKQGDIRIHHFAHRQQTGCGAEYASKMTEWHINWQKCFPEEYREVVIKSDTDIRRADICINNTVFEFQNSAISYQEFMNRTNFYKSVEKTVLWIFNDTEEYTRNSHIHTVRDTAQILHKGKIKGWYANTHGWKLENFDFTSTEVSVYMQTEALLPEYEKTVLKKITACKGYKNSIFQYEEVCMEEVLNSARIIHG